MPSARPGGMSAGLATTGSGKCVGLGAPNIPIRYCRRQRNDRFVSMPCSRASFATDAAESQAAASARLHCKATA